MLDGIFLMIVFGSYKFSSKAKAIVNVLNIEPNS